MTQHNGTAGRVLAALKPYGLRDEGSGKYRSNSPLRPGSNSHGFTLTIDDDEHGAFYDHVSGEQGSLYDLANRLGIERSSGAAPREVVRAVHRTLVKKSHPDRHDGNLQIMQRVNHAADQLRKEAS
jgi:hypothetical protein